MSNLYCLPGRAGGSPGYARRPTRSIVVKATRTPRGCDGRSSGAEHPFRHHQIGPRIPPVPAARARQGAWRVEPPDHGMEHQADAHPQLRLILPDAGPGCETNGRRATWAVTTRSGRHQVPVAVLPTAKSLSAFSLKPQSDRLLGWAFRIEFQTFAYEPGPPVRWKDRPEI